MRAIGTEILAPEHAEGALEEIEAASGHNSKGGLQKARQRVKPGVGCRVLWRAGLAGIAACAVAFVISGCGGGSSSSGSGALSKQEYSQKLEEQLKPLKKSLKQLQSDAQSATSKQQLTSALAAADNAAADASDRISGLDPPSDAISTNADLVSALDTYGKSIETTEETVGSGTKQQINAQVKMFKADSQSFVSSLNKIKGQLKSEGIDVSGGQ